MLVLQRKRCQSIMIGDNIELSVLDIGSDWVKLAISAPKDISILRAELAEAAKANRVRRYRIHERFEKNYEKRCVKDGVWEKLHY